MNRVNKPTETFNVKRRCEEIHAQYGTSEMANYRLQQMCDKIAQDAFVEGMQSMIDNIPDLEWEECVGGYIAETDIFNYYIDVNENVKEKYTLEFPTGNPIYFLNIDEAKQAANKYYKGKLKKALGL
ncbi:hypothetical protein [Prevotella sp. KH2C16]|uniref:hypothetical protein n=1 Tax=Prevotella sp. KH2C16 TaxID=1855325 RepID=UPI0008EBC45C|nr:hypothetical protein [Prevotella sp. KH2C16]SFG56145.1 hypothetical protein SAMN05216383_12048 [Prevotella sp. KH2C16]